jgi:1-acyl-sn-glycerol-3-phosphate acyltransferase
VQAVGPLFSCYPATVPGPLRALTTKLLPPLRGSAVAGWTAVMLAAAESHKLLERKLGDGAQQEAIFDRYMRAWTGGILRMCAVEVLVVPGLPPAPTKARLVVSNHRSALDIPILLTSFGGSALSRADLEHWPLIGLAAQQAQTIFVDRESRQSGAHAIRAIRAQLQRGRTVNVFPEGTVFAGDEVRPFNAGAFAAARGLEVEFVPVGVAYPPGCEWVQEDFIDHATALSSRPRTTMALAVGEPRRIDGRAAEVSAQLHAEVERLVLQARRELDRTARPA